MKQKLWKIWKALIENDNNIQRIASHIASMASFLFYVSLAIFHFVYQEHEHNFHMLWIYYADLNKNKTTKRDLSEIYWKHISEIRMGWSVDNSGKCLWLSVLVFAFEGNKRLKWSVNELFRIFNTYEMECIKIISGSTYGACRCDKRKTKQND